jgi:PHD/YefM family antitoxin component YafN of YafNO toxin-antitoxin module
MEYHVNIMKPIDAREVYSLSEFQRNAKKMIAHLKEHRKPLLLTVNGSAEVVVMDAAEYQEYQDQKERAEFIESLKRGIAEADAGLGTPIEEVFAEIEEKYGL